MSVWGLGPCRAALTGGMGWGFPRNRTMAGAESERGLERKGCGEEQDGILRVSGPHRGIYGTENKSCMY